MILLRIQVSYKSVSDIQIDNFFTIDSSIAFIREYDDMSIFVLGGTEDNELIVSDVLDCIHECFDSVYPKGISRKSLTSSKEGMLLAILIIDELVDDGVIMTTDQDVILDRINFYRRGHATAEPTSSHTTESAAAQVQ